METILDAIGRHAAQRGGERVYWTPRRTWTFAELWHAAGRAAAGLARQSVGRGDRVACLTKHTAECVARARAPHQLSGTCGTGSACRAVTRSRQVSGAAPCPRDPWATQ